MNRSDIVDQVLLSQLPDNVFMRGQDFGALPDDNNLGFAWGSLFSAVGRGAANAGRFAMQALPKALPTVIDLGSQFAQFKMQKDLAKAQANAANAYSAAQPVSLPSGSTTTTPSFNPYSQPTASNSILTQQVAGIPVWALGAGGVVLLILLLRR